MHAILLTTDGTAASQAATRHAVELARDADAVLHVLAVRPPAFFGIGGPTFVTRLEEVHAARSVACETAAAAEAEGIEARAHDIEGSDAGAIIAVAVDLGVDLIVVGCRDAQAADRGHAGSVSRALAEQSPVPVTVVPVAAGALH